MERHAVLRTLRNGELPPEFVSRWPKEAAFVLWLMAEDPRMRPSAREILEFDLIRKVKEEAASVSSSGTPTGNDGSSGSSRRRSGQQAEGRQKEDLHGLGLLTETAVPKPRVSSLTGKSICEDCQARCRCSSSTSPPPSSYIVPSSDLSGLIDQSMPGTSISIEAESSTAKPKSKDASKRLSSSSHGRGHRSSKSTSTSQKLSRSELEQKLTEETERSKRLEMSLEAMRAEQKALLDRIQALEYEKELSWHGGAHGGSKGPVDDDDEL